MVATKISEVAGKGIEWARSADSNDLPSTSLSGMSAQFGHYWSMMNNSVGSWYDSGKGYASGAFSSWSYFGKTEEPKDTPVFENIPSDGNSSSTRTGRQRGPSNEYFSSDIFAFLQNPYISVRGGRRQSFPNSSLLAVRHLISSVPGSEFRDDASYSVDATDSHSDSQSWIASIGNNGPSSHSSPSETASQLAEGSLRAFRDIALDEAVELHEALRYWSYRWERPLLSWLEAGPWVWMSPSGYQHHRIGQRVSQIQAVLARRCASIGDLQQHLLRSGWQRGVSDWGVLGEGGEWAAMTAFDGSMNFQAKSDEATPGPSSLQRVPSGSFADICLPRSDYVPQGAPASSISRLPQHSGHHNALYYTTVFVKKHHDGLIHIEDPALAEWSVDAIKLVRSHIYRAANGNIELPHSENWSSGVETTGVPTDARNVHPHSDIPLWASFDSTPMSSDGLEDTLEPVPEEGDAHVLKICDISAMAAEVGGLLDAMEKAIGLQRQRRLDKLKPYGWIRRNWYTAAIGVPLITYTAWKLNNKGYGLSFLRYVASQIIFFFKEHVSAPIQAIVDELFKGAYSFSDREALNVVTRNLKLMIRNWLEENYPDMPTAQRNHMAEIMDMSLIESRKAESVKSFYEINNVIRMSFIEAQFLKKEMMNALVALDEMQSSNNMNMNLAAVTPAVLILYGLQRSTRFVRYALFKVGRSKMETYSAFLHGLLEMERLLVMRDNPPQVQAPGKERSENRKRRTDPVGTGNLSKPSLLGPDDLGMLMLHIHELRTILWRDRRRFSPDVIGSVAEDLAELSGERGAVHVHQQLQIIDRMTRTYTFLKVAVM